MWADRPVWVRDLLCLGLLLLIAMVFTWPTTFGGQAPIPTDVEQYRGMAEAMLDYEEATGDDALWAPNLFGGMPGYLIHYKQEAPQLDDLPRLLRMGGMWPVQYLFVLMAGMYALLVFLTRTRLAGLVAAVAFALTTYLPIIIVTGHNTKFIALAYAPWLLLAFAFALNPSDKRGWQRWAVGALIFAIALAINLRAKHVQITYYVAWMLGIWWVTEGIGAVREGRTKTFGLATAALAVGSVLALLMVAQPFLLTFEHKAFTIRGAVAGDGGGLAWERAMAWSQGASELLTLVVANAFGGSSVSNTFGGGDETYWGPKIFTFGPHYVGPVVLVLAALALWGVRRRTVWAMGISAGLMTLFSLGEYLPLLNRPLFDVFPLFSAFRVPETWLSVVALALAVLAGYGVYYLMRREPTPATEQHKTRSIYATLAVTGGFLAATWLGGTALLDFEQDNERTRIVQAIAQQNNVAPTDPRVSDAANRVLRESRAERVDLFRADATRSLVFFLLFGALLVAYRMRTLPPWTILGVLLLVLVDLWGIGQRYFNDAVPQLRSKRELTADLRAYDFDRFIIQQVEVAGGAGHFRTLPEALNPRNSAREAFFYESTGGYHGAKLALYQDYLDEILYEPNGALNENGLDLMSNRFVVARRPMLGLNPVYQDESTGLLVLENPDYLPRASLIGDTEIVLDDNAAIARLTDDRFDPRRTAVLTEADAASLPDGFAAVPIPVLPDSIASDSAGADRVDLKRFTPREIVWEVHADAPRLLVASEVYYPAGWTATVSDEPAPIVRVNHLLRGVPIPEGQHIVRMRFDPPLHETGYRISLLATLFVYGSLLFLGAWTWYRRGQE
ncbi:MAG: hypothetical protein AAF089_01975 [Bacteroidota bacterium]